LGPRLERCRGNVGVINLDRLATALSVSISTIGDAERCQRSAWKDRLLHEPL
jgi:hypothetical protein